MCCLFVPSCGSVVSTIKPPFLSSLVLVQARARREQRTPLRWERTGQITLILVGQTSRLSSTDCHRCPLGEKIEHKAPRPITCLAGNVYLSCVRKIRCDALANGCTNCTQQRLECYVTDRVTGRTERRGYLQQLEREKTSLLGHIRDLEKLLEDKGIHVRPWQAAAPTSAYTPESPYDLKADQASKDFWPQPGSLWDNKDLKNDGLSLNGFGGQARPVDSHHLGIAQDYTSLSSIDGTRLSILGTTIDVTSFDAPDMDGRSVGSGPMANPVYNKSAESFYSTVSKLSPPVEVSLPPRDEAFNYSEWFFAVIGVFIPVLHKPTYMELLSRLYDDPDFKPSRAELAMVHMLFAMMYYQFGCRDGGDSDKKARFNEISNRHYHWCVDKMWDLLADTSLASVQALVLMATHCRSFPKPGPAFVICSLAWNRAIECNLHRPFLFRNEPTTLENEMRKRAFWSIFTVVVMLYGRLGRPMPIRSEDIDVDLPIAIPDECLTEQGITDPERIGECSWLVGLAGFKLSPLFLEMWNNAHPAQQDPTKYVEAVRRVEQAFQAYQRDLDDQLRADTRKNINIVHATYLESSGYELLMCLRHPSRCATSDPAFLAENYAVCEDMARKLLRTASDLAKLKSLDTTWYQIAVYVAAVFTLLACRWNKRAETTAADLMELKEYMSMGMAVVSEILNYVGMSSCYLLGSIFFFNFTVANANTNL
ncbi:hypothetical protein BD289DRAFT_54504 [Coniella lustricola]|uniref:Xylanolytic transcriptional activator regulatory domain-containing protein n=1 Tax=Coniella lustricola TaxID=2025994 RepID=A0A2T3A0U2_9PEZI|nr:hypothetical protein BD289DRAFT_54504 [Coniella lustricola]